MLNIEVVRSVYRDDFNFAKKPVRCSKEKLINADKRQKRIYEAIQKKNMTYTELTKVADARQNTVRKICIELACKGLVVIDKSEQQHLVKKSALT